MRIAVVAYVTVLLTVFTYLIGATLGSPVIQGREESVAGTTGVPFNDDVDAGTTPQADEPAVTVEDFTQRARQEDEDEDEDDDATEAPAVVSTSAPIPPPRRNESTFLNEFNYIAQVKPAAPQVAAVNPAAPQVAAVNPAPQVNEEDESGPTEAPSNNQQKSVNQQETEDQDSDNEITQDEVAATTSNSNTFEAEYKYTLENFNKPKNRDAEGVTTGSVFVNGTEEVESDSNGEMWEYSQHLHDGEGRAACECGKVPFKIDVDRESGINPSPWLAAIVRGGLFAGGRPHCGGTLINDLYVLTSASCMDGLYASSIQVWLTAHDTFDYHEATFGNIKVNVEEVIMHPNYNRNKKENDLCLLKLSKPVDISSKTYFVPACLPAGSYNFAGTMARVNGWSDNKVYKVCKTDMPILDNAVCDRDTSHTGKITSNMVCAGYLSRDKPGTCTGDAGGPLIVPNSGRSTLVGVVSWGYESRGRDYMPTVFTRVSEFSDWILHNTRAADWCGTR